MRIVVISDSHGNRNGIDSIFNNLKFDYLFFLGDGVGDLGTYKYLDNVYAVSGNCDIFSSEDVEKEIVLQNNKFLLTHGHKYKVKYGMQDLMEYAETLGVNFVLYGHTHKQKIELVNDIYYINPGSFQKNYGKTPQGLIVNIDGKKVDIENLKI